MRCKRKRSRKEKKKQLRNSNSTLMLLFLSFINEYIKWFETQLHAVDNSCIRMKTKRDKSNIFIITYFLYFAVERFISFLNHREEDLFLLTFKLLFFFYQSLIFGHIKQSILGQTQIISQFKKETKVFYSFFLSLFQWLYFYLYIHTNVYFISVITNWNDQNCITSNGLCFWSFWGGLKK